MRAAQFFIYLRHPDRTGLKSVPICEICGKKGKAAKKSSKEKICVICEICVTKKSPDYFRNRGFLIKEGGYLLSRIALQYHRRK
jgi:hypothetical protein